MFSWTKWQLCLLWSLLFQGKQQNLREGLTGWKCLWEVTPGKSRQEEVTQTTQGPAESTTGRGFAHG